MVNIVGYLRISAFRVHVFHLFYSLGFLLAIVNGFLLAEILHLQWWVITILSGVSVLTFFSLVKLVRHWYGSENIVYYHHEIGILLACLLALFITGQPVLPYLDVTITGIGIFNIFGRWGCFFVGCCHGKPCRVGVMYDHRHVQQGFPQYYENIRLFPIQLIESAGAALLVVACIVSAMNGFYQPGEIVVMYSVLYGCGRFVLEIFRGDSERGYWFGLSEAQWTSIGIIILTTLLGYLGYLPLYGWHLMAASALLALALSITLLYKLHPYWKYLNPRHIHELATALYAMRQRNINLLDAETLDLSVYTTRLGITVSYSGDWSSTSNSYVYGLSGRESLNRSIARRLGKLIGFLNRHQGSFELLYDGKGAYYVVFEEKKLIPA